MPYSQRFESAFEQVLDIEGGYSNHVADSGGKTKFGITEPLAREYDYNGAMRDLSLDEAKSIYYNHFWLWMDLDSIHSIAPLTARELFDAGVNVGRRQVWRWLQQALNALNRNQRDYANIKIDGWPGPNTQNAIRGLIMTRGEDGDEVLSRAIDCKQGAHYLDLAEARPKDQEFVFGWFKQRIS